MLRVRLGARLASYIYCPTINLRWRRSASWSMLYISFTSIYISTNQIYQGALRQHLEAAISVELSTKLFSFLKCQAQKSQLKNLWLTSQPVRSAFREGRIGIRKICIEPRTEAHVSPWAKYPVPEQYWPTSFVVGCPKKHVWRFFSWWITRWAVLRSAVITKRGAFAITGGLFARCSENICIHQASWVPWGSSPTRVADTTERFVPWTFLSAP